MRQVSSLWAKLGIDNTNFMMGLSAAARAAEKFQSKMKAGFNFKGVASDVKNFAREATSATDKVGRGFKDVGRIVQGILVSQAFYQAIGKIREMSGAVTELTKETQNARIAFSMLFKSVPSADKFLGDIEDYATTVPYSINLIRDSARKLVAAGFGDKEAMDALDAIVDAATMAGGKDNVVERLANSLVKIKATGRLTSRHIQQFATAGIPIFDILQEKLGLTEEQLANIGKLQIPADTAIQAILMGIAERYGGAAELFTRSLQGQWNRLTDNLSLIGRDVFAGMYQHLTAFVKKAAESMAYLRSVLREQGLGGLFEALFPPELHHSLKLFVANIQFAFDNLRMFLGQLWPYLQQLIMGAIGMFNMIMPPINALVRWILLIGEAFARSSWWVRAFTATLGGLAVTAVVIRLLVGLRTAIMSLGVVKAVSAMIVHLANALEYLAITIMVHPLLSLVAVLAGVAAGVAIFGGRAKKSVEKVGSSIDKAFGYDPDKLFIPKEAQKENIEQIETLNKGLKNTTKSLDKVGKAGKKAAKKVKEALMSFDEVFTIRDEADPIGGTGASGLDDIFDFDFDGVIPEIPAFDMESLFPEIEDFGDLFDDWAGDFVDKLTSSLGRTLAFAGIGALIGGIIGSLIAPGPGTKIGAVLGAGAGALVAYYWEEVKSYFSSPPGIGAAVGASIGATIGTILAPGVGTAIGAVVGGAAGDLVTRYWKEIKEYFSTPPGIGAGVGASIGAILGTILSPGVGTVIGAVIGGAAGDLVTRYWEDIKKYFGDSTLAREALGGSIGAVIGGVIGTIFGPAGTIVGGLLGIMIGKIVGRFWEQLSEYFTGQTGKFLEDIHFWWDGVIQIFRDISWDGAWWEIGRDIILGIWTGLIATVGTILSSLWRFIGEPIVDAIKRMFGIKSPAAVMEPIGKALIEGIFEGFSGAIGWLLEAFGSFAGDVVESFTGWISDTGTRISEWAKDTGQSIKDWAIDKGEQFKEWWSNGKKGFSDWATDTGSKISDWSSNAAKSLSSWGRETGDSISTWVRDKASSIATWAADTGSSIGAWASESKSRIGAWAGETGSSISSWYRTTKGDVSMWASNTRDSISTWYSNTSSRISTWASNTKGYVSDWRTNLKSYFSNMTSSTQSTLSSWINTSKKNFSNWAKDTTKNITDTWSTAMSKLRSWWSEITQKGKQKVSTPAPSSSSSSSSTGYTTYSTPGVELMGHYKGGIFNKEHIARFAEGNKMEAILPVENPTAMAKVRRAIFGGEPLDMIREMIEAFPVPVVGGNQVESTPLYVGTLIADDRGLRELERRMYDIRQADNFRRGR